MLDAICTESDKVFSIFEFKVLPDAEINRLRYSLLCPVCKQRAYFRRASRDGKQACFGSRYHDLECEEFNPSSQKTEDQKQLAEVEKLVLEVDELLIDFSVPISRKSAKPQQEKNPPKARMQSESIKKEGVKKESEVSVNKQTLKKLLVSLLRGSSLASSDLWIYTSEKHKWRAKNLFVNVNDATPTDNGAPRLYWGTLSHADKTLNWLNPAEERSVAIPLSKFQTQFVSRFDIQEPRDVEGAGFIIFAKCVESKDKKRKFLQLWGNDLNYFYISKVEE